MTNTARSAFASDIKKLSITNWEGKEVGVSPQVTQIKIFQSIFTKSMSIEMMMSEGIDLIRSLPIRGGEKISVEWQTPGQELMSAEFILHSITNMTPDSIRQGASYTILGVHESALLNKKRLVSRAYRDTAANIVAKVAEEFLQIELAGSSSTPTMLQYIAPNVSPHRVIDMVAAYAAKDSEDGTLLFYQNQKGHFFRSVTDMVEQGDEWTYILSNEQPEQVEEQDLFRIVEITEPSRNQFADMISKGSACSTLVQVNPLTRKFERKHTRREESVRSSLTSEQDVDTAILDKYRPDNPDSDLPAQTFYRFDETAFGLPQTDVLTTFGGSLSLITQLRTNVTTITVPLNSSLKVGDRIKITASTPDAFDAEEIDPQRDVPYLVTSIAMVYAVDEQTFMIVELSRDGAPTPIEPTRMLPA